MIHYDPHNEMIHNDPHNEMIHYNPHNEMIHYDLPNVNVISSIQGVDWKCVRYMFGEIQYGGRVTDDYDKRLLNTFCRVWFSDEMFLPTFQFFKGYVIPQSNKIGDCLEYIQSLPPYDTPEVFGLHSNADITWVSDDVFGLSGIEFFHLYKEWKQSNQIKLHL